MRVLVNGLRLYVDVDGSGLVPDGPVMRGKPTLILLHGGPGADHSIYKPDFAHRLGDLCQIIYVDHRGNGRSDDGDPADWNLDQWGDDIRELCAVLEIEKPIVLGASFGGFVAQSYATRHPDHIGALILSNTTAKMDFDEVFKAFDRVGGATVGAAARAYWNAPTPETRSIYSKICLPFYAHKPLDPDFMARIRLKDPVAMHFNGPDNEMGRFDFRAALAQLTCPTLVISGGLDPITPPVFSDIIAACLKQAIVTTHCLDKSAHLPDHDTPDTYFAHLRDFISRTTR